MDSSSHKASMKGLIFLFLILSLPAFGQTSLVMWHTQDHEQKRLLEEIVAQFTRETAIAVQLETGMEIEAALITQIEGKTPPDVVFAPANLISFRESFKLSKVSKADLKGIDPQAMRTVVAAGEPYGVPIIQGNHLMIFSSGAQPDPDFKTWTVFQNAKSKQTMAVNTTDAYIFLSFYRSHGGGASLTIAPTPCKQTLEFYRSNFMAGVWAKDCGYECVTKKFYDGIYPLALNGDWALKDATAAFKGKFHWYPLPTLAGAKGLTPTTSHALLFPGGRETPVKAKELAALIKFLLSDRIQEKWWQEGFRLPVQLQVLQKIKGDPRISEVLRASFALPTEGDLGRFWHGITKGLKLFHADHKFDPEASCNLMERLTKKQ